MTADEVRVEIGAAIAELEADHTPGPGDAAHCATCVSEPWPCTAAEVAAGLLTVLEAFRP